MNKNSMGSFNLGWKLGILWKLQGVLCRLGLHRYVGPVVQFETDGPGPAIKRWIMVCIRCGKQRLATRKEMSRMGSL